LQLLDKQRAFFRTHKTKSLEFRREQLLKLKSLLEQNQDLLVDALHKDLRRSPEVTIGVEMRRVMSGLQHTLEHFEEWAKPTEVDLIRNLEIQPFQLPSTPIGEPKIVKEPLGNVLVIGAFNFPIDLSIHPAISALAAGCTVVVKPSELSAHTSQAIYELISKNFEPVTFYSRLII
jgi:aldehyde dehydrogenase (NAD+)